MEVRDYGVLLFWKHLLLDSSVSTTGQERLKRCELCFTSVLNVSMEGLHGSHLLSLWQFC